MEPGLILTKIDHFDHDFRYPSDPGPTPICSTHKTESIKVMLCFLTKIKFWGRALVSWPEAGLLLIWQGLGLSLGILGENIRKIFWISIAHKIFFKAYLGKRDPNTPTRAQELFRPDSGIFRWYIVQEEFKFWDNRKTNIFK